MPIRQASTAGCWRTTRRCRCCKTPSTTCASSAAGRSCMAPALPPIERSALLLDLDGTLLDFAPTPDAVTVPAELRRVLRTLRDRLNDAVAVVTGRPVETIEAL